jgi:hypothetical protein
VSPDDSAMDGQPTPFPEPEPAGKAFDELIRERLQIEEARKSSLESRGVALVSATGAVVTVVFAFVAVMTTRESYEPPVHVTPLLISAIAAFVLSAGLALLTNIPIAYRDVSPDEVFSDIRKYWQLPETRARMWLVAAHVSLLKSSRTGNRVKACLLIAALLADLGALVLMTLVISALVQT